MKRLAAITAAVLLAGGCATGVHRGSVAMKISGNEAHICLGKGEVAVGDSIEVFRNVCPAATASTKPSAAAWVTCEKKFIGHGTVKSVLNEHYSIAALDPGAEYREGDIVELRAKKGA